MTYYTPLTRKLTPELATESPPQFVASMRAHYGACEDLDPLIRRLMRPQAHEPFLVMFSDYDDYDNEFVGKYAAAETDLCVTEMWTAYRDGMRVSRMVCRSVVRGSSARFEACGTYAKRLVDATYPNPQQYDWDRG